MLRNRLRNPGVRRVRMEIATPRQVGARNDMRGYRTFPRASEANMPPKQRMAKMMNDVFILSWKRG